MCAEQASVPIPDELMPKAGDLPGALKEIAELIGVDNAIKLAQEFRGCSVYICNIDSVLRKVRNKHIRDGFDKGDTITNLARKYRLSTRQIQYILSDTDQ